MPHIGYDIDGKKVMRPATGDELDRFLTGVEDEMGGWANVMNKNEQELKTLSEEELNLIQRLAKGENPDENYDPLRLSPVPPPRDARPDILCFAGMRRRSPTSLRKSWTDP